MNSLAEYIWIDGTEPVARLRSKTKVLDLLDFPSRLARIEALGQNPNLELIPVWGFDGSSTNQADGSTSDCILKPACVVPDPTRNPARDVLVMCEVLSADLTPDKNNHRSRTAELAGHLASEEMLFGIEQEYTFFKGRTPLGWPEGGYPAPQGPFYCGIGADEVFGRDIVEEHLGACVTAGLRISGINAEVMPGQWEFQIGPAGPLEVGDHLWLARYLLYRIAEKHNVNVKLDPKPIGGDWNGAGAHTNFSTLKMRSEGGLAVCIEAAEALRRSFERDGFPKEYGHGYESRLTGAHETCSYREFKYGVGDRTASVRIPLHVEVKGFGYIEDRRPCANIDPYQVVSFLAKTVWRAGD